MAPLTKPTSIQTFSVNMTRAPTTKGIFLWRFGNPRFHLPAHVTDGRILPQCGRRQGILQRATSWVKYSLTSSTLR